MKVTNYLVVNQRKSCRLTKGFPSLQVDEIAIKLTVEIPDGCFRSPVVDAEIIVHEQDVVVPTVKVTTETPTPPKEED